MNVVLHMTQFLAKLLIKAGPAALAIAPRAIRASILANFSGPKNRCTSALLETLDSIEAANMGASNSLERKLGLVARRFLHLLRRFHQLLAVVHWFDSHEVA